MPDACGRDATDVGRAATTARGDALGALESAETGLELVASLAFPLQFATTNPVITAVVITTANPIVAAFQEFHVSPAMIAPSP